MNKVDIESETVIEPGNFSLVELFIALRKVSSEFGLIEKPAREGGVSISRIDESEDTQSVTFILERKGVGND